MDLRETAGSELIAKAVSFGMVGKGDVGGEEEGCSSSDEDSEKKEGEHIVRLV